MRMHQNLELLKRLGEKYGTENFELQPFLKDSFFGYDPEGLLHFLENQGVDIKETFSKPVSAEDIHKLVHDILSELYGPEYIKGLDPDNKRKLAQEKDFEKFLDDLVKNA